MSELREARSTGPSVAEIEAFVAGLALPSPESDDTARIDRIAALERLKGAVAAAQARETVAFKGSQLEVQQVAGVRPRDLGKGIGAQVALARRESPYAGSRLVGLAEALLRELPHTLAALTAGDISEWRAILVCRETACLSRQDRMEVDARLANRLWSLSDRHVVSETRRLAYRLDPHGFLARSSKAATDRRVTLRPAPDTMTLLSALLPVTEGVALYAALCRTADAGRAAGDHRSRGQLMADTLVERVTGRSSADQTPVEIQLVMTDRALLDADPTPARINGYGPVPASWARQLLGGLGRDTVAWIRRLYTHPDSGQLIAMESNRRLFPAPMRSLLITRDETCRTPWCGAPIRHLDHAVPHTTGGSTSEPNGQGLCESCNYVKQTPGWTYRPDPRDGAGGATTITTPTAHAYTSRPPPLPGAIATERTMVTCRSSRRAS